MSSVMTVLRFTDNMSGSDLVKGFLEAPSPAFSLHIKPDQKKQREAVDPDCGGVFQQF